MDEIGIIDKPEVISKKYYRDRNRFVQIPHYEGMYYNSDNTYTFTSFPTSDTIGICVEQTLNELIICEVTESLFKGSYDECLNYCKNKFENGYIPSLGELMRANENNYIKDRSILMWVNNNCIPDFAWTLYFDKDGDFGNITIDRKRGNHSVLAFCKIKY